MHALENSVIDLRLEIRSVLNVAGMSQNVTSVRYVRSTATYLLQLLEQSLNSRDLLIEPSSPVWPVWQWRPGATPATPEISISPELNNRPAHEIPAE